MRYKLYDTCHITYMPTEEETALGLPQHLFEILC